LGTSFEIIVVGGGHAGIEAAWAAARMGARVALITMQASAIGRMSCNPAIGGLAKGQIVREIDALGGLMGLATDAAGIQFRMLNRSKGPAVWAPRAQADRDLYPRAVQRLLAGEPRIEILEGLVEDIEVAAGPDAGESRPVATGVTLVDGRRLRCEAVILTTGTFLRGLMHCGTAQASGGRIGEQASVGLSAALLRLGFELGRLKTGTPPRIARDSIDYAACQQQPGDEDPTPFSMMTDRITQRQVCCWITYTNADAHEHIRGNLHRAPMYSGQIQSQGPRYCPSIEDKVVRFADKSRHQVFLEPEGYDHERIYCNGISTSLPAEVQDEFVRCIPGLENARILQHGYAVEYDWVPTHQTSASLESKRVAGLFFAGQINGTSGYEEAAAQGLMAGVNAVQRLRGGEPVVLGRDQAYIGVLVDDLVTKPHAEPYRMFTSRAEYRLNLRSDNADQRLTPIGRALGLVDDARWARFEAGRLAREAITLACARTGHEGVRLSAYMRRPEADAASIEAVLAQAGHGPFPLAQIGQVLVDARYSGYLTRQAHQVDRMRRLESLALPENLDYRAMGELRLEAREKLSQVSPRTLGQASRISGISPADITVLWVSVAGRRRSRAG
jgi:tRNA uridine 5-carboxymethylaminomethyl modification enzyme